MEKLEKLGKQYKDWKRVRADEGRKTVQNPRLRLSFHVFACFKSNGSAQTGHDCSLIQKERIELRNNRRLVSSGAVDLEDEWYEGADTHLPPTITKLVEEDGLVRV
ncbi:hypothetical protein KEM54_004111 [Ascosphaera aggregata]|nr:hypothetical protein KEM54_004111 [Ascosphaera aggregata]